MEWNLVELENGLSKLVLAGRMDVAGALAVDPVFSKLASNKTNLAVDISDVSFLASLGLRSFVITCKALAEKGGNLILVNPQPGVAKVLKTSGISTIIPVVSDMEAAEALLRK